jgi:HEAT repeat protein
MRRIVLVACVLCSLCGAGVRLWGQEPPPKPKSVPQLIEDLRSKDEAQRIQAIQMLAEWGPQAQPALPDLNKIVGSNADFSLRHEAIVCIDHMGSAGKDAVPALTKSLDDQSKIIAYSAAQALGSIGPAAKTAMPALQKMLKAKEQFLAVAAAQALVRIDPDNVEKSGALPVLVAGLSNAYDAVKHEAVFGLTEAGAAAVPEFVKILKKGDNPAKVLACDGLGRIGPAAKDAVPELVKQLDGDPAIAGHAAMALAGIGPAAEAAVPALRKALASSDNTLQLNAAVALGGMGEAGHAAVPDLVKLLKDDDAGVRRIAARSLGGIGPAAADAVPALAEALHDDQGSVTIQAAQALAQVGKAAVPAVAKVLDDEGLRPLAASVLADIGSDAKAAVPGLIKALDDKRDEVRREVCLALASIGPDAKAAEPRLLDMAKNPTEKVRGAVLFALVKMQAKEVVPILKDNLNSDNPILSAVSAWGLIHFDPKNEELIKSAMPRLINMLKHELPLVRREAASALMIAGPHAKSAVPDLVQALQDPESNVRAAVLEALAAIGIEKKTDIAAVVLALQDPDDDVRHGAAFAIGQMGPKAAAAEPELLKWLRGHDQFDQIIGAWALMRVAPNPKIVKEAAPMLITALKSPNTEMRVEAAETLGAHPAAKSPEVLAALTAASKDSDAKVAATAAASLKKLQTASP